MKNKLADLNNHLFAQLERLGDESLSGDELAKEVTRSEAIVQVSEQLIRSANVTLNAAKLIGEYGGNVIRGDVLAAPRLAIDDGGDT